LRFTTSPPGLAAYSDYKTHQFTVPPPLVNCLDRLLSQFNLINGLAIETAAMLHGLGARKLHPFGFE
jgi:hypothetical protein